MIEDVKELCPELEILRLGDSEALQQGHILRDHTRLLDNIHTRVAQRPERGLANAQVLNNVPERHGLPFGGVSDKSKR